VPSAAVRLVGLHFAVVAFQPVWTPCLSLPLSQLRLEPNPVPNHARELGIDLRRRVRRRLRAAAFAGVACSHSIAIRRVRSSQPGGIPVNLASFAKETLVSLFFQPRSSQFKVIMF
jgi:hypothetical protein